MRRRLGEHGLEYRVITIPRPRTQRQTVEAVSGQILVPVLVAEENGEAVVLSDENDIHAYLDRRIGPQPRMASVKAPADGAERLRSATDGWSEMADWLISIAREQRERGHLDEANCLHVAGLHLRDAARWTAEHLPED